MSDEELRALARDGTPAGRLKHARALERLGRRDEALLVLLPAREDAFVRRALGAWPAWTHLRGDRGDTRSVDVEPVRRTPVVRWRVPGELDPTRTTRVDVDLVANPLVVVATQAQDHAVVLDAESGRLLWRLETSAQGDGRACLAGDTVLVRGVECAIGFDAWTGEERWRVAMPIAPRQRPGRLILSHSGEELVAWGLEDPRSAPRIAWRSELRELEGPYPVLATRDDVFVPGGGGFIVLDARSGRIRSRAGRHATVWAADDDGLVSKRADAEHGALLELTRTGGDVAWGRRLMGDIVALSRELVVIRDHEIDPTSLVLLARETGAVVAEAPEDETSGGLWSVVAAARDVLYVGQPPGANVRALDAAGEALWTLREEEGSSGPIYGIVPAHRRLYTYARDGTVTCYAEPA